MDPLYEEICEIMSHFPIGNVGYHIYRKLLVNDDKKLSYYGFIISHYNYKISEAVRYMYYYIDDSIFIPLFKKIMINNYKNVKYIMTIRIINQMRCRNIITLFKYLKFHNLLYLLDRINPNKLTYNVLILDNKRKEKAQEIYKETTKLQDAFIEAFYRGNRC